MKVVVCWPRFGPYHIARLEAVAAARRVTLCALETDPRDSTYAWQSGPNQEPQSWERVTVENSTLAAELTRLDADVVFVNGWGFADSLSVINWAVRRGTRICLFSDSRASDVRRRGITEHIKGSIVQLCDAALVAGPEHGEYLRDLGMHAERIFDGYDVVDNDYFARRSEELRRDTALREDLGLPCGPFFLSVGRFVAKKNLLGLLRAYETYRASLAGRTNAASETGWALVIVGDGPERSQLEERISASRFRDDIFLLPFAQYDKLPAFYSHASCFVLASIESEQWGLVVNEAMACKLPVLVSSACGCASELVNKRNGIAFDPFDESELASALQHMASLPNQSLEALGRGSREIISEWSLERFVRGFLGAAEVAASASRRVAWTPRMILRAAMILKSRRFRSVPGPIG